MILQKALLSIWVIAFASAGVLLERQATNKPIPAACVSQCTALQQVENITAATIGPLCTTAFQQQVLSCLTCIETNAPDELTADDLTYLQVAFNAFQTTCVAIGSPLPSVSVPGATGTSVAYSYTASMPLTTGTPTTTVLPTTTGGATAPPPSSTTSTRSGATTVTAPQTFGAILAIALVFMVSMV